MKIIDGRLRPPFASICAGRLFDPEYAEPLCAKFGRKYPDSAKEKSMDMVVREMEAENIICGLTPIRRSQGRGMKNDDFTLLNEQYPGKFIGFAGLDTTIGVKETLGEIEQYVTNGSFIGVNFEPDWTRFLGVLIRKRIFPFMKNAKRKYSRLCNLGRVVCNTGSVRATNHRECSKSISKTADVSRTCRFSSFGRALCFSHQSSQYLFGY